MYQFRIYANKVDKLAVCTSFPTDLEARLEAKLATGRNWIVSPDKERDGTRNGQPCGEHLKTHRHLLLDLWDE